MYHRRDMAGRFRLRIPGFELEEQKGFRESHEIINLTFSPTTEFLPSVIFISLRQINVVLRRCAGRKLFLAVSFYRSEAEPVSADDLLEDITSSEQISRYFTTHAADRYRCLRGTQDVLSERKLEQEAKKEKKKKREIRGGDKEKGISFWEPVSQTRMMYSFFYFSKLGSWRLGFWTEQEGWGLYRHATEPAVFIYTSRYREDLKIPKEGF